jgi:hypothetical protein
VLPVGTPVVLDDSGFLDVAMAGAWWVAPEDRPVPVTELCGPAGSFVLLAADGTGKSTVLGGLRGCEAGAVEVNLPALGKEQVLGKLLDAAAKGIPVYLDALDLAARLDPAVYEILRECLNTLEAGRIRWRLACRPAAWDQGIAEALRSSHAPFRELRLLPLTRTAAAGVAAEEVSDPDGFVEALISAGLGRLAASPMRLKTVARDWQGTGNLTASQLDAIRLEIDHLLQETSSRWPRPVVPQDRRRRLAGRLAAMMIFGKAARFTADPRHVLGTLNTGRLPSDPEADQPGRDVSPAEYDEVLGTALFDVAADSSVVFRHQQYAEFLAAEYVTGRPVTCSQLPVLLGMAGDGAIPGSLAGAAAWIAALDPGLGDGFPESNALALAKTGVELPSHAYRAAIADKILADAACGDADPLPGQDLRVLAHPDLAAQLAGHLARGLSGPTEFWWITTLAAAGECRSLAGDLTRLLTGSSWPAWARRAGLGAVTALGQDQELLQLKDLARLGPDTDPVDSVLADVIGALYPRLMSTAEVLSLLRSQRSPESFGPYAVLLSRLSTRIPDADVPAALSWAAGRVQDGEDAFGDLLPQLVRRGWESVTSPGTREPLAQLTAGLAGNHSWPYWPRQDDLPWLGHNPTARRPLAVAVAGNLKPGDAYSLLRLGLLDPGDLGWILRELPSLPTPARDTIARCVSQLALHPQAGEADLILGMDTAHPAYPYTGGLRQTLAVDCEQAQLSRLGQQRDADAARRRAARRDERTTQLMGALDDAARDPGCWWLVARWLTASDDRNSETLFSYDLTARPGWALLTEPQRQQVLDLGVRYLETHQPQPSRWAGRTAIPADHADQDWQGVYLLTTLASHDHARLASLGPPVWQAWAPALVGARSPADDEDVQARCRLTDLAPPAARQDVADAAVTHLDAMQEHGGYPSPYQLYAHLCPSFAPSAAERVLDGRYHGTHAQTVLGMLIEHAPGTGAATCRQIAFTPGAVLAEQARLGLAALDPDILIDDLHSSHAAPGEIAGLAPHFNIGRLDDSRLAMLGRLLLQCAPFASDPPLRLGVHTPDPGYEVRGKRDRVLATLADHGQAGFFEELAARHDPASHDTITWHLRQARSRSADTSYPGIPPGQMLHLLSRADARLIRHGHDLQDVVIAQLGELQREITQLRQYQFLWDNPGPDGTPKSEDTISDWVRQKLQTRLQEAFFEREAHVSSKGQGIGTRIDIEATATTATHRPGKALVIAEAKHTTHDHLTTAMHTQLIEKYMLPKGARYGIYLIYWTDPSQRAKGPRDRDQFLQLLEEQAAQAADQGLKIRPYLLDISYR